MLCVDVHSFIKKIWNRAIYDYYGLHRANDTRYLAWVTQMLWTSGLIQWSRLTKVWDLKLFPEEVVIYNKLWPFPKIDIVSGLLQNLHQWISTYTNQQHLWACCAKRSVRFPIQIFLCVTIGQDLFTCVFGRASFNATLMNVLFVWLAKQNKKSPLERCISSL